MADVAVLRPKGIPTIFGGLEEKSLTFLIDTSGSMYPYLDVVKEHLIEVLLARSFKQNDTMFNIMEFSSEVIPWADRVVKCTPQTVTLASEWVKNLGCKTGTNTLDALLAGFADPECEAVYLVTDGLPDQMPEKILQHIAVASEGRPVHAIYLAGGMAGMADVPACDFLSSLATETAGTLHSISLSNKGFIEEVKVLVRSDHAVKQIHPSAPTTLDNPPMKNTRVYDSSTGYGVPSTSIKTTLHNLPKSNTITYINESDETAAKMCSVTTSVDHDPIDERLISIDDIPTRVIRMENVQLHYPDLTWEAYRPTTNLVRKLLANADKSSVTGGVLLQGMRVLARRDKDGFYCLGFVKHQITANHTFLIEYDKEPGSKAEPQLQETAIYDIISYNDASRHSIAAGDKVLAPQGKGQYRYAPGTVLEGLEGRSSGCAADTENLVVSFFDGKTEKILKQASIWIPHQLYERVKLEIQMPITARQYLINNPRYPIMLPPGYDSRLGAGYFSKTGAAAQETGYLMGGYDARFTSVEKHPVYVPVYPEDPVAFGFRMPSIRDSAVKSEEVHRLIPGTSLTKEDLNRKVMQQLMDHKMIPTKPLAPKASAETEKRASPPQSGILRKSVSFRKEDREMDSGIDSYTAISGLANESQSEPESEDEDNRLLETGTQTLSLKDSGVGTDYSLLYNYRPDSSLDERPPWQYWNPSSRSSNLSSSHKSSKAKSFRDTALSAPAEAKLQSILAEPITAFSQSKRQLLLDAIDQDIKTDRAQLEWIQRHPHPPIQPPYDPEVDKGPVNRSGAFNTVDHQVKSDRAHLEWILKQPRPPNGAVKQQGVPAYRKVGSRDMVREAKEKAYLEYRRNQVMQMDAHFSQLETDARRMKEAKVDRCSASLAVEESLTMRYDSSHLIQAKDTITTDQISEIAYPDNTNTTYTPPTTQSHITDNSQPLRKTREKLTVQDVVFGERKTLTPPPEPKHQNASKLSGQNDSPRGHIVVNPYIVNHSYSVVPLSNLQDTGASQHGRQVIVQKGKTQHSKSSGVKSLQAMSELQKCSKRGQKKVVQVTNSKTDKIMNRDLEDSLVAFLEENSRSYNTEEMMHNMQQMMLNLSYAPKPVPPARQLHIQACEGVNDRFHNKSTIRTLQKSKEVSNSSTVQNHVITKTVSPQNRLHQQHSFNEIPLIQSGSVYLPNPEVTQKSVTHNSSTTQHNSSVTQKQSVSEHSVTQNSLSNSSGPGKTQTVRSVENSQVCTEVKSAVQKTTETKAKMAASTIPKLLPHQKFAADVTRRDVQRQQDSEDKLKSIQDAKQSVSSSIARQQQERSNREVERNAARVEVLRKRTQRREDIATQREKEIQDTVTRRQEIRQQRQDHLTRRHVQNLVEQDQQEVARDDQRRNNEIRRREFFYDKEQKNQEAKDLRLAVREQKFHDLRSQVLP